MTITVDTPEGIEMFRLLAIAHALSLEVNTGMKMSRGVSVLAVAQRDGLTVKRTKKGALKDVIAYIQRVDPEYQPSDTIIRAMG
jgi:hypothetical protein